MSDDGMEAAEDALMGDYHQYAERSDDEDDHHRSDGEEGEEGDHGEEGEDESDRSNENGSDDDNRPESESDGGANENDEMSVLPEKSGKMSTMRSSRASGGRGSRIGETPAPEDVEDAIRRGDLKIVARHVMADTYYPDTPFPESGNTPLIEAALHAQDKLVEFLMRHGASVNAKNNEGMTVLQAAVKGGAAELVNRLLEAGPTEVETDAQDNGGNTALHAAADRNDPALIKLLLDHGAVSDIKNGDGQTPLDLCSKDDAKKAFLGWNGAVRGRGHKDMSPEEKRSRNRHEMEVIRRNLEIAKKHATHYKLDMARKKDWDKANELLQLAMDTPGENWLNEKINGVPFRLSAQRMKHWSLPHSGILEFDFVENPAALKEEIGAAGGAPDGTEEFWNEATAGVAASGPATAAPVDYSAEATERELQSAKEDEEAKAAADIEIAKLGREKERNDAMLAQYAGLLKAKSEEIMALRHKAYEMQTTVQNRVDQEKQRAGTELERLKYDDNYRSKHISEEMEQMNVALNEADTKRRSAEQAAKKAQILLQRRTTDRKRLEASLLDVILGLGTPHGRAEELVSGFFNSASAAPDANSLRRRGSGVVVKLRPSKDETSGTHANHRFDLSKADDHKNATKMVADAGRDLETAFENVTLGGMPYKLVKGKIPRKGVLEFMTKLSNMSPVPPADSPSKAGARSPKKAGFQKAF